MVVGAPKSVAERHVQRESAQMREGKDCSKVLMKTKGCLTCLHVSCGNKFMVEALGEDCYSPWELNRHETWQVFPLGGEEASLLRPWAVVFTVM